MSVIAGAGCCTSLLYRSSPYAANSPTTPGSFSAWNLTRKQWISAEPAGGPASPRGYPAGGPSFRNRSVIRNRSGRVWPGTSSAKPRLVIPSSDDRMLGSSWRPVTSMIRRAVTPCSVYISGVRAIQRCRNPRDDRSVPQSADRGASSSSATRIAEAARSRKNPARACSVVFILWTISPQVTVVKSARRAVTSRAWSMWCTSNTAGWGK